VNVVLTFSKNLYKRLADMSGRLLFFIPLFLWEIAGIASFDIGFFYGRSCKKIGSFISFDTGMPFYLDEFQIIKF
jgi:hypothetical protein